MSDGDGRGESGKVMCGVDINKIWPAGIPGCIQDNGRIKATHLFASVRKVPEVFVMLAEAIRYLPLDERKCEVN